MHLSCGCQVTTQVRYPFAVVFFALHCAKHLESPFTSDATAMAEYRGLKDALVREAKKSIYWDYFTAPARKRERPNVVTDSRLVRVKPAIFADADFWSDIFDRHNAPEQPADLADHGRANWWAMISRKIRESQ